MPRLLRFLSYAALLAGCLFLAGPAGAQSPSTTVLTDRPSTTTAALERAAQDGDARAMWLLSQRLGRSTGPENNILAFRWLRQAADKGWVPAMFDLSYYYLLGHGVPQDVPAGRHWREQAYAELQKPVAATGLQGGACTGNSCKWTTAQGDLFAVRCYFDFSTSIWIKRCDGTDPRPMLTAAETGDRKTQFQAGSLLLVGQTDWGVKRDLPRAQRLLESAAAAGCPQAYVVLGNALVGSQPQDRAGAAHYFQRALDAGLIQAQADAGWWALLGGVGDEAASVRLLETAAARGDSGAMADLAGYYSGRFGYPKNEALEKDWMARRMATIRDPRPLLPPCL